MTARVREAIADTVEYLRDDLAESASRAECMRYLPHNVENYVECKYGEWYSDEERDLIKEEAELQFMGEVDNGEI